MKITIVGGGNIGTQFAVHCAEKGHDVIVFTSKYRCFEKHLYIVDEKGKTIHEGDIVQATDSPDVAFVDAELIFVTVPAYCMKNVADRIEQYIKPGVLVGLIPGLGGGECIFKKIVDKGGVLFGIQRVPSVARLVKSGQITCASGYRPKLFLAALPQNETEKCCELMEHLLDMPCEGLPNYLNVTLTPSNPILHTTRLCVLFKDYLSVRGYEYIPLFYEEWDDNSSELLLKCDDELQNLCAVMHAFDLSYVKSLRIHYESDTVSQLTQKMKSIESLKGLATPTVEKNGVLFPDFASRYFTADFPYGLAIIKQIADFYNVSVPHISETLEWYNSIVSNDDRFSFSDYGISNQSEFEQFYLK